MKSSTRAGDGHCRPTCGDIIYMSLLGVMLRIVAHFVAGPSWVFKSSSSYRTGPKVDEVRGINLLVSHWVVENLHYDSAAHLKHGLQLNLHASLRKIVQLHFDKQKSR